MKLAFRLEGFTLHQPNPRIVDTARRDSAFRDPEGKWQSVPEEQDQLDVIEAEARETDKALREILKKIGVGS